ncbi:MAG TPA: hypothetical protein DD384_02050 [Firmicutes bacterium]|nr:hypothetical protein [Bacillota bacterium]
MRYRRCGFYLYFVAAIRNSKDKENSPLFANIRNGEIDIFCRRQSDEQEKLIPGFMKRIDINDENE